MSEIAGIIRDLNGIVGRLAKQVHQVDRDAALSDGVLVSFCHAAIDAHPDRDALRAAWNRRVSDFWANAGTLNVSESDRARRLQALIDQVIQGG